MLCCLVEKSNLYQGWELISRGVIELAFALLDTKPALGGKPDKKIMATWKIGKFDS